MTRAWRDCAASETGATDTGMDETADAAAAPSEEDLIARHLQQLFRRFQDEPLPARLTELLSRLSAEAGQSPEDVEGSPDDVEGQSA